MSFVMLHKNSTCFNNKGETIMQNNAITTTSTISTTLSKPIQIAAAIILGTVIIFAAGFVNTSMAHNAAHDTRHSQGFPCH
tara:strand:+ start:578 stop:820 length:243 start_codon:yes stop_codon:yes gene_type:complete